MNGDDAKERAGKLDARSGLSHDAIRAQVLRILGPREFQATDKMRDFLRFVVEEKLAGRARAARNRRRPSGCPWRFSPSRT